MTLEEIREKKFSRAFKGYSDAEVNSFIEQVASAFEQLENEQKENSAHTDELGERLAEYESMDREMRGALLAAQKASREIIEEARRHESLILEEAKETLKRVQEEAKQLGEQTEALRKQKLEEIDRQALDMRIQHAREMDALKQRIRVLEAIRAQVHSQIETMLSENIGQLNIQLQNLAVLPPETMLETEQEPEDNGNTEPVIGCVSVTYSSADIPGAEDEEELPKLDFQT